MEQSTEYSRLNKEPQLSPSFEVKTSNSHAFKVDLPKILKLNATKENHSPKKVKEILKVFKQYKSSARILKQSPYCSTSYKHKIINNLLLSPSKTVRGPFCELSPKVSDKKCLFITLGVKGKYALDIRECLNQTGFISMIKVQGQLRRQVKDQVGLAVVNCLAIGLEVNREHYQINVKKEENRENIIKWKDVETLNFLLSIEKCTPQYLNHNNSQLQQSLHLSLVLVKPSSIQNTHSIDLSQFKIIRCLGSGGFSTVCLAKGLFNNKYYAMKIIDKDFIMESQRDGIVSNQRYLLSELRNCGGQNKQGCKFITQLEFAFETYRHFIFMIEYCPGGELFNQLKRVKKMTQDQARFYFLQILTGLNYVHNRNIVYRDLKPENLLIDQDGHIKIADFGLSKPVDQPKDLSYSFCGSPEYMAPEMLTKQGHNYLLDYYCLGALLYELVVGVPPYYSLDQEEIYDSILNEQLSFPSHVSLSEQLINLLKGLLTKEPKHRLGSLYGIKEILFHPWIGKINRKVIEQRNLKPPFVPDLSKFNFDLQEVKTDLKKLHSQLHEDLKNSSKDYERCFSQEFEFVNQYELKAAARKVQQYKDRVKIQNVKLDGVNQKREDRFKKMSERKSQIKQLASKRVLITHKQTIQNSICLSQKQKVVAKSQEKSGRKLVVLTNAYRSIDLKKIKSQHRQLHSKKPHKGQQILKNSLESGQRSFRKLKNAKALKRK